MKQAQQLLYTSKLYIVPTPIGNLKDITLRALSILQSVDLIAAEDTRHTSLLLKHFNINTKLISLHNYNEHKRISSLIAKLNKGQNIALVSDAGTPLINDPGYCLVRYCRNIGINIVPLPGPCAAITALSAAGLPANRFCYEGFLPAKRKARTEYLKSLALESRTLIFYESTHRLLDTLKDMILVWGSLRYIVLAKELTKIWETIYGASISDLLIWVQEDKMRQRGEITLVVDGAHQTYNNTIPLEILNMLSLLISEISLKKATTLVSKIYGIKKSILYNCILNKQLN